MYYTNLYTPVVSGTPCSLANWQVNRAGVILLYSASDEIHRAKGRWGSISSLCDVVLETCYCLTAINFASDPVMGNMHEAVEATSSPLYGIMWANANCICCLLFPYRTILVILNHAITIVGPYARLDSFKAPGRT